MGLQKSHGPYLSHSSTPPPLKKRGLAFFRWGREAGKILKRLGGGRELLKGVVVLKKKGLKVLSQEFFLKKNWHVFLTIWFLFRPDIFCSNIRHEINEKGHFSLKMSFKRGGDGWHFTGWKGGGGQEKGKQRIILNFIRHGAMKTSKRHGGRVGGYISQDY